MSQFVKIILNGKLTSVYAEEAAILVENGQAEYPEKAVKADYKNKMVEKPKTNKRAGK